ncbi:hypothetical protein ACEQ38_18360 [Ralstonia syzygii subsp. celebesensis]|uniref:hypothetical protein n=1 Tax=Ralstonia syzygii TaxID=28097 RepID=UPI001E305BAF|nr:hypothetical protein [Ralstonia syzygii]
MTDGNPLHLANPAAITQYDGLKYGGDFADTARLAQLLGPGRLPEGTFIRQKVSKLRLPRRKKASLQFHPCALTQDMRIRPRNARQRHQLLEKIHATSIIESDIRSERGSRTALALRISAGHDIGERYR